MAKDWKTSYGSDSQKDEEAEILREFIALERDRAAAGMAYSYTIMVANVAHQLNVSESMVRLATYDHRRKKREQES